MQISRYESTVERLSTELGSSRQEYDQLQSEQAQLTAFNEQLQADLEASQEQVYSQIAGYKSQIDQLQEQLADTNADVSSMQQQQQLTEAAYQQLQSDLSSAQEASSRRIESLKQQVAESEQQLAAEVAQHEEAVQTQCAELAQQTKRVGDFEAAVKESDETRARLEEEYGYALQEAGQREQALREELASMQVSCSPPPDLTGSVVRAHFAASTQILRAIKVWHIMLLWCIDACGACHHKSRFQY